MKPTSTELVTPVLNDSIGHQIQTTSVEVVTPVLDDATINMEIIKDMEYKVKSTQNCEIEEPVHSEDNSGPEECAIDHENKLEIPVLPWKENRKEGPKRCTSSDVSAGKRTVNNGVNKSSVHVPIKRHHHSLLQKVSCHCSLSCR